MVRLPVSRRAYVVEPHPLEHLQGVAAGRGAGAVAGVRGDRRRCRGPTSTPNGRISWKVRTSPAWATRCAGQPVMSWPSKTTRPDVGGELAGDQREQRGLAGAVGSDDAEELALVDVERHVLDGPQAAEGRVSPSTSSRRHRRHRSRSVP